jgi:hypothetical protein
MQCLLHAEKLSFVFSYDDVLCYNSGYRKYHANRILSFGIMDLAFKIIKKQQERKSISLKKKKSIIHLLNYVDMLNFNFNSKKFNFRNTFSLKNNYKMKLAYDLYLHRTRLFDYLDKDFDFKVSLKVIKNKKSCVIRFDYDIGTRMQPKYVDLTNMVIHILDKLKNKKKVEIDVNGIIFYCVFLM